jgi:tRNA(Arg) A34 adenosine deaminase TadA
LLGAARVCAAEALRSARRHSATEYFALLLDRAARAAERGDYGIAAAAVMRSAGVEVVSIGTNSMTTNGDPTGHAEIGALLQIAALTRDSSRAETPRASVWDSPTDALDAGTNLLTRSTSTAASDLTLYATLEPCPMCTVALINAGVGRVIVAVADPSAGALAPERLSRLAPLWPNMVEKRRVQIDFLEAQTSASSNEPFIPRALIENLNIVFDLTRAELDGQLAKHGVLDLETFARCVRDQP